MSKRRKLSALPMTTFFRQGRTDINEHNYAYYTGAVNSSGRPGNCKTSIIPEKPADAISEILGFEKFPHADNRPLHSLCIITPSLYFA